MIIPLVHLNGTSREELLSQLVEAGHALETAISALELTTPNARDYYVQGAGVYREAVVEHNARVAAVRKVRDEIAAIAEAVAG